LQVSALGDVPDGAPFRFRNLFPPSGRSWADPFPVLDNGRYYIFLEEYEHRRMHGRICVLEIDALGKVVSQPRPVLEREFHVSYPFVFRHEGEWYMMPETAKRNAVELFRAARFPDQWEFDRTLVEAFAPVDATLACIEERWWMFLATSVPEAPVSYDELALYYADSPLGPWTPHPRNPMKVDVRSARPAGRLFRHNGAYYRPAQDGTPLYGSAIVMNRIDNLDPASPYRETAVARLEPCWTPGLSGTHTINATAGLTIIDARRVTRRRESLGRLQELACRLRV
jgi:hypothetical protein